MNKAIKEIVDDVMNSTQALQKCQKEKCKKEFSAGEQQRLEVQEQIKGLIEDLKAKNIDINQYMTKSKELKNKILKSKVTKDLMKCTLDECEEAARKSLVAQIRTLTYDCNVEKEENACKNEIAANKIINKKKLTPKDFFALLELIHR